MSCVAEAKAVMMNSISVMLNMLMGVVPAAIVASVRPWNGQRQQDECHRHQNLHGKGPPSFGLDDVDKRAPEGFDSPWQIEQACEQGHFSVRYAHLVNIITEMLFTIKYGMPCAKYKVGTHAHGDMFFCMVHDIDLLCFYSIIHTACQCWHLYSSAAVLHHTYTLARPSRLHLFGKVPHHAPQPAPVRMKRPGMPSADNSSLSTTKAEL